MCPKMFKFWRGANWRRVTYDLADRSLVSALPARGNRLAVFVASVVPSTDSTLNSFACVGIDGNQVYPIGNFGTSNGWKPITIFDCPWIVLPIGVMSIQTGALAQVQVVEAWSNEDYPV